MNISAADFESSLTPIQFLVCRELVLRRSCAMVIGGAIRDYFFSYPIDDVDFIIPGDDPLKGIDIVLKALESAPEVSMVTVHSPLTPYRTAKIKIQTSDGSLVFDIVFPRKETYAYPAAKPEVYPGTFEEDIHRRDFSVNALCLKGVDGNFQLLDIVDGFKDILDRKLRILHSRSFRDDPVRIVRAIRFMHRYDCRFDQETEECSRDPELITILARVSEGRRVQEFYKVLFETKPFQIIENLAKKGFLGLLFPGLEKNMPREESYREFCANAAGNLSPQHQLLSFLLSHLEADQLKHLMQYLPITRTERKQVLAEL